MPLLGETSAYARAQGYFLKHPRQNSREINQAAYAEFLGFLAYLAPADVPLKIPVGEFWGMIRRSTPLAHVISSGLRERTVPYYHWCTFFGVPDIEDLERMVAENPGALRETYRSTWAAYRHAVEQARAQVNTRAATRRTKNVLYRQLGEAPHKLIPAGAAVYISEERALAMLGCSPKMWARLQAHLPVSFRVGAVLGEGRVPLFVWGSVQSFAALWGEGDEAAERALGFLMQERLRPEDQEVGCWYTYAQACELLGVSDRAFRLGRVEVGDQLEAVFVPDRGSRPRRLVSKEKILEISRKYLGASPV